MLIKISYIIIGKVFDIKLRKIVSYEDIEKEMRPI